MSVKSVLSTIALIMLGLSSCSAKETDGTLSANDLIKKMQKEKYVAVDGKHIKGDLKLHEAGICSKALDASPSYIDCEITFTNCVFEGKVSTSESDPDRRGYTYGVFSKNVTFANCTFTESVEISQSIFDANFSMDGSVMQKTLNATGTHFAGGATFNRTEIQQEATLISSIFDVKASFMKADFRYITNMQNIRFNCMAMFVDAHIGGGMDFSNAFVVGQINFTNAQFGSRIECIGTHFIGDIRLASCVFADNVTFEGNTVMGHLVLNSAQFKARLTASDNILSSKPDMSTVNDGNGLNAEEIKNTIMTRPLKPLF